MYIVWALVGLVLFTVAEMFGRSFSVALLGVLLGLLWARQSSLRRELTKLRQQLDPRAAPRAAEPAPTVAVAPSPVMPAPPETPAMPAEAIRAAVAALTVADAPPPPPTAPPRIPTPMPPPTPGFVEQAIEHVKRWFTEGNVPVKIGMLVLFAGVAALLKYAADKHLLLLPIGVRVSLVALAAIVGLAFGWRQRDTRRVFALSLQGGAIGVLVITVFAAFRLYGLLPPLAAFGMLIVLVAGVGMLAVLQDALALAVLGLLAGFAAPILVSTGTGSHVVLFSYYAVLNLAVLGIAWKRPWRVLNLLGFVATFAIGTAWGVLKYRPELFASTEPFLVLNFLFYLAIPLLYLLRAPADRSRVLDGCLLFGNPLVSLLLQAGLLRWQGRPLAISALVVAVIYLFVAWAIRRRSGLGLLRDAWAVLAVAFATLAVPLALSASLTGSIFALEGAGLIWLGLRQQRRWSRWGGLALQLFAAVALLIGRVDSSAPATSIAWLDRDFIGSLLLVAGAFAGSTFYARLGSTTLSQRLAALLLYLWGLCWWLGASAIEIDRYVAPHLQNAMVFFLLALTGWVSAEVARRGTRHELGMALAFTTPVMFVCMLPLLLWGSFLDQQWLAGWSLLAVLLGGVLGWRSLLCLRGYSLAAVLAQLAWWWRWVVTIACAVAVFFAGSRWLADGWVELLASAPLFGLCWLALTKPRWIAQPLPAVWPSLRVPLLYSSLAVLGVLWLFSLSLAGDADPLPYLPLLNPVELLLLIVLLCLARWLGDAATPALLRQRRAIVLGVLGMVFVTSVTLRAVHQLGGVPWDDSLGNSSLAQMSLTVVWSVFGLLAWVWGSRRGQRMVWLAGAITMAVVLAKLLLIDRSHLGNLFGIASFIAYGLLCTVIGYLAPAPPRRPNPSVVEATDAS